MNNSPYNPNGVAVANGNYFGFPVTPEEADLVLLSYPWDVTTSYHSGAAKGPMAIIEASLQMDFHNARVESAWESRIATLPPSAEVIQRNHYFRPFAKEVAEQLEKGVSPQNHELLRLMRIVNRGSQYLNNHVYENALTWIRKGKMVGMVGGEHSVPLGLVKALQEKHHSFGILQIDAHADLRKAYMGLKYSHASIMDNLLRERGVSRLVQVGIRDLCQEEQQRIQSDKRITTFTDYALSRRQYDGESWNTLSEEIVEALPQKVYISFDIDGLDPALCPNTGTPVPGGLQYNQAIHLLHKMAEKGKQVVGFDLSEVAPGKQGDWDANVGARILYELSLLMITHGK
ncbi:MAG: agmatinase [Bacteroidetes bacterium]|nr:MAG: agmatinase [Bacteroidota bacterium]